jgi:arylsulfatase A-like enzyme
VCLALAACAPAEPSRPDLILIVIDALRADVLERNAPHLAELARAGVVFERVVAPSSWTKTSMASILTGTDPGRHGVRGVEHALPPDPPALAGLLRAAGWRTLAVQTNPWLRPSFGFDAGFDRYEFSLSAPAPRVVEAALALLDEPDPQHRPVFVYLHFMDVHGPYRPDPAWFDAPPLEIEGQGPLPDREFELRYRRGELHGPEFDRRARALYEAEVRQLDAELGRLFEALRQRGRLDAAVLAITSDHGEAFGEHGEPTHGRNFYPEVYAVPLLLHAPGRVPAGLRVPALVRSIDIAPTLMILAGLEPPASVQGEPLLPLEPGAIQARVARGAVGLNDHAPDRDFSAVVTENRLYVRDKLGGRVEVYDLAADPGALRDLGAAHPDAAALAALEDGGGAAAAGPGRVEIDPGLRDQLESLGYLEPRE